MSESLERFDAVERLVHRSFAILMGLCLVTAAILYNGSISLAIGHRHLVELVHVWCGLALPVPMLAGALSAAYRTDVRRLNRFTPADWQWLRSRSRRVGTIPVGVQLVGGRYREDILLAAAEAIEAGGTPPSPIDPA